MSFHLANLLYHVAVVVAGEHVNNNYYTGDCIILLFSVPVL